MKIGERLEKIMPVEKDGDWIVVNTSGVDRDRDRLFSDGAVLDSYLLNPVVLWGHNYREPWAVIGRSVNHKQQKNSLRFLPEFRPTTSETDPMTIIALLWEQGFVKTASVGLIPLEFAENEIGGWDVTKWELLEWSLVPVPANAEALRRAMLRAFQGVEGMSLTKAEDGQTDEQDQQTDEQDAGQTDDQSGTLGDEPGDEPSNDDSGGDDTFTEAEEAALAEAIANLLGTLDI